MEKDLFSFSANNLLSHPDNRLLSDHLLNVSKLAGQFFEECKCPLTDRAGLSEVVRLMGLTHDIGKASDFFQKYIKGKKELLKDDRSNHGLISAIITYWLVEDLIQNKAQEELTFLPYIAYLAVKHHHGNMDDIMNSVILSNKSVRILPEQWQSMNTPAFKALLELIGIEHGYELINDKFTSFNVNTMNRHQLRKILKEINTFEQYYLTNMLYSILIDADKTDAGIHKLPLRGELHSDDVDIYRQIRGWENPQKQIDSIRNQVYMETASRIESTDLNNRIMSMNVPTGLGKTFAAFNCALKLREKIKTSLNYTPRIIYALPFLSIIEQNFDEIKKVLEKETGSNILLKHHHLSDVFYKSKDEDNEYDVSESELLIESWNSEIIVTTFIQLFHTIVGYRNRMLKKLHRIANSIVILDEIQSLPHKYWLLLREAMSFMSKNMQVHFLMVTATKPLIFADDEVYPLVDDPKYYFNAVDRIDLKIDTSEKMNLETFREKLASEITEFPDKRFLIVMNTIRSASELYKWLKERFDKVSYLSTHIIPKHRLERIKKAKEGKDIKILVSTQLIEAGVDIDFDVVYRDFAPLDSINQTSGRCNRNMTNDTKGVVKIVRLVDQNNRTYASHIYDDYLLKKTENILPSGVSIGENEFITKNNEYYNLVKRDMSNDTSRGIRKSACELVYDGSDNSVSTFKLIDEDYEKIDIFVEIDDDAMIKWKEYESMKSEKDWEKRRERFLQIKSCFYQYVISVAINQAKEDKLPIDETGIGYVSNDQIKNKKYYSEETGYISKSG
jgi:CRISPR-associated endonuclease/helicase Cas3